MAQATTRFRDREVGEVAAHVAGATAVFRRRRIDFCCGGNITVAEVAARQGLDVGMVEAELAALGSVAPPVPHDPPALVDYLLHHYHEKHRRDLPELVRLARKVEAVHASHEHVPHGLAEALARTLEELEDHMQKEEQVLFPAMQQGAGAVALDMPVFVMRREHDAHAVTIRQLETLTNSFTCPEGACRSWQALYAGTESFVNELKEHIHLENNVLFPVFERFRRTAGRT